MVYMDIDGIVTDVFDGNYSGLKNKLEQATAERIFSKVQEKKPKIIANLNSMVEQSSDK